MQMSKCTSAVARPPIRTTPASCLTAGQSGPDLRGRRATTSVFWLLDSPEICFLPNEPKVAQCLPRKLKKQLRTNGTKVDISPLKTHTKPLKTHLKQHQTMSKLPEKYPKMAHFTRPWTSMGTTPAPGVTPASPTRTTPPRRPNGQSGLGLNETSCYKSS